MENLYKILGVTKNATDAEIKKAYRDLAKVLHPDRNYGNKLFEEKFKELNIAYVTLSDPAKRRDYDFKLFQAEQKEAAKKAAQERASQNRQYYNSGQPRRESSYSTTSSQQSGRTSNKQSGTYAPRSKGSNSHDRDKVKKYFLKNCGWMLGIVGALIGGIIDIQWGLLLGSSLGWLIARFIQNTENIKWLLNYGFIYPLVIFLGAEDKEDVSMKFKGLFFTAVLFLTIIINVAIVSKDNRLYEKTIAENTIESCDNYLSVYPEKGQHTSLVSSLRNKLYIEYDDNLWEQAISTGDYRAYLSELPKGRNSELAKQRIKEQEEEIKRRKEELIEAEKWKTDQIGWQTATERNIISAYKKYLELYPKGKYAYRAKKKIIDYEVDKIFEGEYGKLPTMERTASTTGDKSVISIHNDTEYELTLRYSGDESRMVVLAPQEKRTIKLRDGSYRIAASVNVYNVRNYAGKETIKLGEYFSRYYIVTSLK